MKKNVLILLSTALLLLIIGLIFLYPEKFGVCNLNDKGCIYPNAYNLGEPLIITMPSVIAVSVLLMFFGVKTLKTWSKFALVAIPLLALWIILTPVTCSAALGLCLNKELVSWYASVGFLVISLVIIVYKSQQLRTRQ